MHQAAFAGMGERMFDIRCVHNILTFRQASLPNMFENEGCNGSGRGGGREEEVEEIVVANAMLYSRATTPDQTTRRVGLFASADHWQSAEST